MIWRRPSRSMRRFSWSWRAAMSYMDSPVVMRNPRKGHTDAFAKMLATGLKFCHVGIATSPTQRIKVSRKARFRAGFFCFWAGLFLRFCGGEKRDGVAENRDAGNKHA